MLSSKRNRKAAKRFFKKALSFNHNQIPRVITVDKNPAYPPAIDKLKNDKIPFRCKIWYDNFYDYLVLYGKCESYVIVLKYYIDNDCFHGFVGHSDLFNDFLLIIAFLCELIDLIRH